MPISINNTSYFDITQIQLSSTLNNYYGQELSTATQLIETIEMGTNIHIAHNLSLNVPMLLSSATVLLFEDTEFTVDVLVDFKYASALGFQIGLVNMSVPWGAPLYGLNFSGIGLFQFNGTHLVTNCTVEFENHSFLDVNGTVQLTAYNHLDEYLGVGIHEFNVASHSQLDASFEVALLMEYPFAYSGNGTIKITLDLDFLDYPHNLGSITYG